MIHGVLSTADLRAITAYERVGDVRRCLDQQGIRYFWGKDGVWTTIDLVNAAGGLKSGNEPAPYAADDFL